MDCGISFAIIVDMKHYKCWKNIISIIKIKFYKKKKKYNKNNIYFKMKDCKNYVLHNL